MTSKKTFALTITLALLCGSTSMRAQQAIMGRNLWNDQQTNERENIRFQSANPVRQAFNTQRNSAYAQADYGLTRGSFHAADQSGKLGDMNIFFGGLKQLGRVDLAGSLRYENVQARRHAWNSTYGLEQDNPFIIGDSVRGRTTIEAFSLNAVAAYTFSDQWHAALQVDLKTSASSDQNDPRPKVNTTVLPVTAGAEWQASEKFALGWNLGARLYNSDMSYTNVNARMGHRFFLMKGMGDQVSLSTLSESGYKRDYHGMSYRMAVQGVWQSETTSDLLQVAAEKGFQDAEDGGTSYTYKGGDFDFTKLSLLNRLQFQSNERLLHQIFVQADYQKGEGTWYDQRRFIDTEHNNRTDYMILADSKIHKSTRMGADVKYRLTAFRADRAETSASVSLGGERVTAKHLTDDGYLKQKYMLGHFQADARSEFRLRRGTLNIAFGGGYWMPLGDKTFDTAAESGTAGTLITRDYVAPQFEYLSASHSRASLLTDYSLPLRQETLTLGIFARVDCRFYSDDAEFSEQYKSTSLTTTQAGLYLRF